MAKRYTASCAGRFWGRWKHSTAYRAAQAAKQRTTGSGWLLFDANCRTTPARETFQVAGICFTERILQYLSLDVPVSVPFLMLAIPSNLPEKRISYWFTDENAFLFKLRRV